MGKNKKYLIAANHKRYEWMVEYLNNYFKDKEFIYIGNKDELNDSYIKSINPEYIFFPHWSNIIQEVIYDNYNCIIFHMTDLPFGRGGSPLQNLIVRGIYETKISAIKCVKELDAGPIYLKKNLSLYGNAEEIFIRASKIMLEMIKIIVESDLEPINQAGEVVSFARRKPEESNIAGADSLEKIYDMIRMLDADGYPPAFIEVNNLILEFSRAALKSDYILADVKIKLQ